MDSTPRVSSNHRLTIIEEDYLEAILNVSLTKGYAKSRDVAAELDVGYSCWNIK
jgi:DtxR family Mn-dependent transcriptional regulator